MMIPAWLQRLLDDNPPRAWLDALAIGALVAVVVLVVRAVVVHRMAKLAGRSESRVNEAMVEVVRSVRRTFVVVIAIGVALYWRLDLTGGPAERWIGRVIVLVAVLQAIRTGNRLVDFWVAGYASRRDGVDKTTLTALSYGARTLLVIAVVLIGLDAADYKVGTLLTGLGIGGVAIALALQNILGDLFGAISIVADKPFVVGDSIAVDQFEGTVEHVGLKTTRLRSANGEQVVFSNADLLKSRLRNLTRREGRRLVFTITLAPETPAERLARVPQLVREAASADSRLTLQRSHLIGVGALGFDVETSILIPQGEYLLSLDIRQALLLDIYGRLEREGIALARPASAIATSSVPSAT